MKLYINTLKNPYIIIIIILIAIVVGLISYLDDKANKNNKKSFLGHCKLIMICLLSALIMLFGYIFIVNSSFGNTSSNSPVSNLDNFTFNDDILKGDPGF
jgi:UDP-N-acetylmuramyl pentapeptide phosphotransferase/UDP-N-acetylglucosamine-1-phosphate transferase